MIYSILALALLAVALHAHIARASRAYDASVKQEAEQAQRSYDSAFKFAVEDCALEYIAVHRMDYSHRDSRAHVRAFIHTRYAHFSEPQQAAIMRQAIYTAKHRMNEIDFNLRDINPVPRAA